MDFLKLKPETKELIKGLTIAGALIVLFYQFIHHLPDLTSFAGSALSACMPFIIGFCFAFILLPLRRIIEDRWMVGLKWEKRNKRRTATGLSMIIMLAVLAFFFWVLIPQLFNSLRTLTASMNTYAESLQNMIKQLVGDDTELSSVLLGWMSEIGKIFSDWLLGAEGGIAKVLNYSISLVKGVFNFFIGMIVAFYLLNGEERFRKQFNMVMYALCSKKIGDGVNYVLGLMADAFNRFIFGKAVDSLIIGVVCYLAVSLMGLPYPSLIAFVIGITNMIPIFGPFIGAVPCIIILVMIDFFQALEFLIFIVILQQIDGNIIGPYIIGDSMGLPSLWVMFAIIIGGAMFGVIGMFLGVPIFSVIYTLIGNWTKDRLKEKSAGIPKSSDGRT